MGFRSQVFFRFRFSDYIKINYWLVAYLEVQHFESIMPIEESSSKVVQGKENSSYSNLFLELEESQFEPDQL